jgi:hypothetical protein
MTQCRIFMPELSLSALDEFRILDSISDVNDSAWKPVRILFGAVCVFLATISNPPSRKLKGLRVIGAASQLTRKLLRHFWKQVVCEKASSVYMPQEEEEVNNLHVSERISKGKLSTLSPSETIKSGSIRSPRASKYNCTGPSLVQFPETFRRASDMIRHRWQCLAESTSSS